MARVEVNFDSNEIRDRLTMIANKKGYRNREEFLRDVLTKIAYEEYESETAALYRQSLEKVTLGLQSVYDSLMLNAELGLLKMPTERNEQEESPNGENET